MKCFLCFLTVLATVYSQKSSESLYVTTEFGPIQGKYLQSGDGKGLLATFLSVPYARPPIGALRFRPPQDPLPWKSVRMANEPPKSCHQRRDHFFPDFDGARAEEPLMDSHEDCLYLNIYVPDVISRNRKDENLNGLAVMVWFHGGGFARGSAFPNGDSKQEWSPDPRQLAIEGGIIVVSVQYRLGSLGFLFLDDEGAPGNVGLRDQAKALEWIRRNIFAFGGDPTRITLAGQDAGGISAAVHFATEDRSESVSLQGVILQSSGIQHPWSYIEPEEAFRRTLRLASLLGCPTKGSKQAVVLCLISKSPEEILNKELGVTSAAEVNFNPFVMTRDTSIVTREPKQLLSNIGLRRRGSILIGTNEDEGTKALMYQMPYVFANKELRSPSLGQDQFDLAIDKVFSASSDMVCNRDNHND